MFILERLANALIFYRAAQDAGIWMLQFNKDYIEQYVQAYVESKGIV